MEEFQSGKKVAFDEFKLFYDSAEKVTDRRNSANRWNYSICIAILGAIAAIISWSLSKPTFLIIGIVTVVLLAGMAALYCLGNFLCNRQHPQQGYDRLSGQPVLSGCLPCFPAPLFLWEQAGVNFPGDVF